MFFRQQMKDEVVRAANRLAQPGLFFLAAGIVASILLVVDQAISRQMAYVFAISIALLILVLWLALPLWRRRTQALA